MLYIDLKYAKLMSLPSVIEKGKDILNFRCPLCGDSKKSPSKKRGWLRPNKKDNKKLYFYCHNCNAAMTFNAFLKNQNFSLWKTYKDECMTNSLDGLFDSVHKDIYGKVEPIEEEPTVIASDLKFKNIYSVMKYPIALEYIKNRNIPMDGSDPRFSSIMFTENYKRWINENYDADKYMSILRVDPRIVFPIFNRDGRFIGSQGRALYKESAIRFLTNKFIPDEELLYGIEHIDPNKTIFIVEGIFDALSIKNSMAMLTSWTDPNYIRNIFPKSKIIFIFDNEKRNPEIRNHYEKLANMEDFGMMIWGKEKSKDLNEMSVTNKLTQDQLTQIVEYNSVFGILNKKLQLEMWLNI